VIPNNPCGAIVDWGRFRYQRACRFFRNSDRVDRIIWYKAREEAQTIPYPVGIYNPEWDVDGEFPLVHDGIGDVWDAPKTIDHFEAPIDALGKHQCGDERDFEEGAEYDPDRPPIPYREDGLPVCCGGEELGGIGWGGHGRLITGFANGGMSWLGNSPEGWDVNYVVDPGGPYGAFLFESLPDPDELWYGVPAGVVLASPLSTGTPGLWRLTADGSGPISAGDFESGWWSGWGTGTFSRVSGTGPPSSFTVVRGDAL